MISFHLVVYLRPAVLQVSVFQLTGNIRHNMKPLIYGKEGMLQFLLCSWLKTALKKDFRNVEAI